MESVTGWKSSGSASARALRRRRTARATGRRGAFNSSISDSIRVSSTGSSVRAVLTRSAKTSAERSIVFSTAADGASFSPRMRSSVGLERVRETHQPIELERSRAALDRMHRAKHGVDRLGIGVALIHREQADLEFAELLLALLEKGLPDRRHRVH